MGVTERLDHMVIRVSSPDGGVHAELRGRSNVHLGFAPGFYRQVTERDLERRLADVGRLLWVARIREYSAILADEFQQPMTWQNQRIGQRDIDFGNRRDSLVAQGCSSDGRIQLLVRGMRDWAVRIADGTLRDLGEEDFAQQAGVAAAELIRDQQEKVRELKVQIYDPEFVAEMIRRDRWSN